MKKFITATFILLFSIVLNVSGQTSVIATGGNWDNSGSWEANTCANGYPGSLNNATGETFCKDITIIPEGVTITIRSGDDIYLDGELQVYGTLIFRRGNGGGDVASSVIMSASSIIKVASTGILTAQNPGGNEAGNASDNFVTIGSATINGAQINNLASPNQLTETTIAAGGGCAETGGCNANPLPIVLKSFTASIKFDNIHLDWVTAKEENFSHFEVERTVDNVNYEPIAFVQGNGESLSDVEYEFMDDNAPFGVIYYRLKSVDNDGSFEYSWIISVKKSLEGKVNISPNPANASENIKVNLPRQFEGKIAVVGIYDLNGTMIQQLQDVDALEPLKINSNIKTGMYLIKIQHNGLEENIRLLIR